jgi:hypothetical protein
MFLRNKTERLTNTALPALGGALGKASVARYGMYPDKDREEWNNGLLLLCGAGSG